MFISRGPLSTNTKRLEKKALIDGAAAEHKLTLALFSSVNNRFNYILAPNGILPSNFTLQSYLILQGACGHSVIRSIKSRRELFCKLKLKHQRNKGRMKPGKKKILEGCANIFQIASIQIYNVLSLQTQKPLLAIKNISIIYRNPFRFVIPPVPLAASSLPPAG